MSSISAAAMSATPPLPTSPDPTTPTPSADPYADLKQQIAEVVRDTVDEELATQGPELQRILSRNIDDMEARIPGIIDAEVARHRESIERQLRDAASQQVDAVRAGVNRAVGNGARWAAIVGGAGVVAGAVLGRLASTRTGVGGIAAAIMGATAFGFMGATAGFVGGAMSATSR